MTRIILCFFTFWNFLSSSKVSFLLSETSYRLPKFPFYFPRLLFVFRSFLFTFRDFFSSSEVTFLLSETSYRLAKFPFYFPRLLFVLRSFFFAFRNFFSSSEISFSSLWKEFYYFNGEFTEGYALSVRQRVWMKPRLVWTKSSVKKHKFKNVVSTWLSNSYQNPKSIFPFNFS